MSDSSSAPRGNKHTEAPRIWKVFIVDDHPLLRRGLADLIGRQPDMILMGEAEDAEKGLEGIAAKSPDIALIDISLKGQDGLELIRAVKLRFPAVACLVVSVHDADLYAGEAVRAGADGYVMKHESPRILIQAVHRILGAAARTAPAAEAAAGERGAAAAEPDETRSLGVLSDRELEVFRLMGRGRRTKAIAEALGIGAKTVETHCAKACRKLGLDGTVALMQLAIRWTHSRDGGAGWDGGRKPTEASRAESG